MRYYNYHWDQDQHEVDLEHSGDQLSLLVKNVRIELLGHNHVNNDRVWIRLALQNRIRHEVLHVTEAIVLVLCEVVDVYVVGDNGRFRFLHWNACLHLWPLVIKEKFELILVALFIFCDSKSKAKSGFVIFIAVSRLGDVRIDSLLVRKALKVKELSQSIQDVLELEIVSLFWVDGIAKELHNRQVLVLI